LVNFLGSLILVEGLLLCTCAEPCPDDRSGSIQYQDKEVRKKRNNIIEVNTFKDSVQKIYDIYTNDNQGETPIVVNEKSSRLPRLSLC